jgi:fatty acid desaturase
MPSDRTALDERRDLIALAETPTARAFVRRWMPELRDWHRISNARSAMAVITTVLLVVGAVAFERWAGGWMAAALAFGAIGIAQHRINVIQHEAIHGLLFRHRGLNDLIGHHLFGASVLTPFTYRLYHFKHHRELGHESDPDRPGYTRFPTTGWGVAGFLLENLVGVGVVARFLAETRSALARQAGVRAYHERRGWGPALKAWGIVALVQTGILAAFVLTGGTVWEFAIFWVLPELTLTRTLMAVRLMGEHTTRGDEVPEEVRYLVTLPCHPIERALFAPLGFNYHAEHHLFPWVPWHRLGALHERLMADPEYRQLVEVRPGYLAAIGRTCIRRAVPAA